MTPATSRQVGRVHAELGRLGITDRDEKLTVLSALLYKPITSSKDLTFGQASIVIDLLAGCPDRENLTAKCEAGRRHLAGVPS